MSKYSFGAYEFSNQNEIKNFTRNLLNGEQLEFVKGSDEYNFLFDLFSCHHRAIEKLKDIDKAIIEMNSYGNKTFTIVDLNGDKKDISYLKCVHGKPTPYNYFSRAARNAVVSFVIAYKNKYFGDKYFSTCESTGQEISVDDCHVDHAPPNVFSKILLDFIEKYKIDLNNVEFDRTGESCFFIDKDLAESFYHYHENNAELRVVSKDWNMKMKAHGIK